MIQTHCFDRCNMDITRKKPEGGWIYNAELINNGDTSLSLHHADQDTCQQHCGNLWLAGKNGHSMTSGQEAGLSVVGCNWVLHQKPPCHCFDC